MITVFIDTNIIIDLGMKSRENHEDAVEIFSLCAEKEMKIFTSTHCIATSHYFLKKESNEKGAREFISNLFLLIEILSVTKSAIENSISSNFNDFEDAIQYFTALSNKSIQFIITNDKVGFRRSTIPVLSSREFLNKYFQ